MDSQKKRRGGAEREEIKKRKVPATDVAIGCLFTSNGPGQSKTLTKTNTDLLIGPCVYTHLPAGPCTHTHTHTHTRACESVCTQLHTPTYLLASQCTHNCTHIHTHTPHKSFSSITRANCGGLAAWLCSVL